MSLSIMHKPLGFPGGAVVKNPMQKIQVQTLGWKDPWNRKWQPPLVFLPGKFHAQRSLEGYSLWGCKELDMTERLSINP